MRRQASARARAAQDTCCVFESDPPRSRQPRSGWACDEWQKRDQGRALPEAIAEFARTPAFAAHHRLPEAKRRDPDSRVAFSLVAFFRRSKRKLLAAGQPPANRPMQRQLNK